MILLSKELRILLRNRSFILFEALCSLFLGLLGAALGFGMSALSPESSAFGSAKAIWLCCGPLLLAALIFGLYPKSEDARELLNGGLENLLSTPLALEDFMLGKIAAMFLSIYIPTGLFTAALSVPAELYLGAIMLFLILPLFVLGIISIYVASFLTSAQPVRAAEMPMTLSAILIFVVSYMPMLYYRIFHTPLILSTTHGLIIAGIAALGFGIVGYMRLKSAIQRKETIVLLRCG